MEQACIMMPIPMRLGIMEMMRGARMASQILI